MAGFTAAYSPTVLAGALANTDYFMWSTDGNTETGILARTPVGSWSAATAAKPSVTGNAATITTAAATGTGTITHYAVNSASAAGTQKTEWQLLDLAKPVTPGDKLTAAAGQLKVQLN